MLIPVSSKFGEGAKASFYSNVLALHSPNADDALSSLRKCYDLHNGNGKHAVYQRGLQLLDIDADGKQVLDAVRTYARDQRLDQQLIPIHQLICDQVADQRIIDLLPLSLTAAFSRMIADQINQCERSISNIKQILAGKGFLQANLNVRKWHRGDVEFNITSSDDINVRVIGSKSAIDDHEAKHGTLNYLVTRRK